MKILAVLTFLIALCAAQQDFTYTFTANATQTVSVYNDDSPGSCTGTLTYTATDKKLVGTATSTGLKGNITACHIHAADDGYSVTVNNGSPLPECTCTSDAAQTLTIACDFSTATDTKSIDALCGDRGYVNIHTDYEPNGELRANLVGLNAKCLFKDFVPDDGVVVVADTTPDTGVMVASFCTTFFTTPKTGVTSNAGGFVVICWDSSKGTLTFSGVFYGLTSDIYSITVSLSGESSYFLYITGSSFAADVPFAFVQKGVTDWNLAKLCSTEAYINVNTYDYTDGELIVVITPKDGSTGFPANKAVCRPATPKIDDTTSLKCWYGFDSTQYEYTCSAGQFCSVEKSGGYDYKSCSSLDYCYTCDCGVDYEAELPTFGVACCTFDYCNVGSVGLQYCLIGSGAGSISVGLLVSLFVALLMKWFN
jgi:hypothetical protein